MVAMLPLVGTGLGLVTCLVWLAVSWLGGPGLDAVMFTGAAESAQTLPPGFTGAIHPVLTGAIITAAYFLMTGFIHLDGFMDVADAVMPRHPRMEERIRILKDPHTGSFAAISMALMFLLFAASAGRLSEPFGLMQGLTFIVIVTTSRAMSAVQVISCRPMGTSQYVNTGSGSEGSFRRAVPALVILALVLAAAIVVLLTAGGMMPKTMEIVCLLAAAAVTALTGLIIGHIDRKALGGMNGDISGHLITSSEMAGMLAAALLMV